MTGFEPRISDVGSNRSANWATTTAQFSTSFMSLFLYLYPSILQLKIPFSSHFLNGIFCSIFFNWAIPGLFFFIFVFSIQLTVHICQFKFCQWLDSNPGPLESDMTALPTEPHPLPSFLRLSCLSSFTFDHLYFSYTSSWLSKIT